MKLAELFNKDKGSRLVKLIKKNKLRYIQLKLKFYQRKISMKLAELFNK